MFRNHVQRSGQQMSAMVGIELVYVKLSVID